MRREIRGPIAALVTLGVAVGLTPQPPAAATDAASSPLTALIGPTLLSSVPVPEKDPFYRAPTNVSAYRDGQIIRTRTIPATVMAAPLPGTRASQILYRTEDRLGRPIATATTLLIPTTAWTGTGTRPLVSYQVPEDGTAGKCAPSYAYRANPLDAAGNAYPDQATAAAAVKQGWAVSVPDYEGPKSEFLIAGVQAKGVLDGIRASLNYLPAHLNHHTRIGLWGYSGGGLASLTAAQWQPTYARELNLVGTAAGAPATDISASIQAMSGGYAGGAVAMGINGFLRAYPAVNINSYLTAAGVQKVAAASGDCIANAAVRYPLLTMQSLARVPNVLEVPAIAAMLRENSPLAIGRVPTAPIYHYHAMTDELAPYAPALATMRKFCRQGDRVQEVAYPVGEHLAMVAVGVPGALQFLANRFAGAAPVNDCAALLK